MSCWKDIVESMVEQQKSLGIEGPYKLIVSSAVYSDVKNSNVDFYKLNTTVEMAR